jgi:hypothetical protein
MQYSCDPQHSVAPHGNAPSGQVSRQIFSMHESKESQQTPLQQVPLQQSLSIVHPASGGRQHEPPVQTSLPQQSDAMPQSPPVYRQHWNSGCSQ